jgi:hypothetical protein
MTDDPFERDTTPKMRVVQMATRRADFVAASGADDVLRASMQRADVLIVPLAAVPNYTGRLFPSGTTEFLRYLERTLPEGLAVEIAVDDAAYEELALHAADILLPALHVVGTVLAELAIGMFGTYLYDRIKDATARRATRVRATLYVESEGGTFELSYDGPAETFNGVVAHALRNALVRGPTLPADLRPSQSNESDG